MVFTDVRANLLLYIREIRYEIKQDFYFLLNICISPVTSSSKPKAKASIRW